MRSKSIWMAGSIALLLASTACEGPEKPPNPEGVPADPAPVPDPGVTTGRVEEAIDQPLPLGEHVPEEDTETEPMTIPDSVVGSEPLSHR